MTRQRKRRPLFAEDDVAVLGRVTHLPPFWYRGLRTPRSPTKDEQVDENVEDPGHGGRLGALPTDGTHALGLGHAALECSI